MVEPIDGLPHGVLGFRLTGKLERDEYHDALMAPMGELKVFGDGERAAAAAWLAE